MRIVIIAIFSMFFLASSNADDYWNLARNYYEKSDSDDVKLYIFSSGASFAAANSLLKSKGLPRLYCAPSKMALTTENYVEIFEDQLKKIIDQKILEKQPNIPMEYVLLTGLVSTFPCKLKN